MKMSKSKTKHLNLKFLRMLLNMVSKMVSCTITSVLPTTKCLGALERIESGKDNILIFL